MIHASNYVGAGQRDVNKSHKLSAVKNADTLSIFLPYSPVSIAPTMQGEKTSSKLASSALCPFHVKTSVHLHGDGISITNNVLLKPVIRDLKYTRITKMLCGAIGDSTIVNPNVIDELWGCITLTHEWVNWAAILVKCGMQEDYIQMVVQVIQAAAKEYAGAP
jgi:hypothetical protein